MTNPQPWTTTQTTLLIVLTLLMPLAAWLLPPDRMLLRWIAILVPLVAFTMVCGYAVTGRWLGALIDNLNVMSLSRFQMLAWTMLILSAYLTVAFARIYANVPDPLGVKLPEELWVLMGISTTSLVGSPMILGGKAGAAPNEAELGRTLALLGQQGDAPDALVTKGSLVGNRDAATARWSDMVTGEEVGNAGHLDIARVQMFFFTLVTLIAYAVMLAHRFATNDLAGLASFPPLDKSMLALIAISHGGYLVSKAAPHSQPAAAPGRAPAPAAADDHPAMG